MFSQRTEEGAFDGMDVDVVHETRFSYESPTKWSRHDRYSVNDRKAERELKTKILVAYMDLLML